MKLIIRLIVIGALTYFFSPMLEWWTCIFVAFIICCLSPSSGLNAFVSGFLGVGLIWMSYAWNLNVENKSTFSNIIAEIMQLTDPIFLIIATGLVGGFAGGFAALSGSTLRQLFIKNKKRSPYS